MEVNMGKVKSFSFGGCAISKINPQIPAELKVLNVKIPFVEALKLDLALTECLRKLNRYKLSTKEGRRACVNLVIHANKNRIAVTETKLTK